MFGLFNMFGRSPDLKALDQVLRDAGLHPGTVPEAVKLTAIRLLRESVASSIPEAAFKDTGQLLGFCMLGRDQFIASNSIRAADQVEERMEAAIAAGDSLDAKLLLLAVHSGIMTAEVADRFDVETD